MEEQEQAQHESRTRTSTRFWNPIHIHSPHHLSSSLQTHHRDRSLSESHTQFKSLSTSPAKHAHLTNNDVVFPPINHEGLHLSDNNNSDQQVQVRDSPCSSGEDNGLLWVRQGESGKGGEMAWTWWVGFGPFGFKLLRSRVTFIASSLWNFAGFGGVKRSFGCAAQVAAAVLVWWFFAVVRHRRRASRLRRRESRDQLIRVIKDKDEKIGQLLHQIAQMNQLLLSLHGDPFPGAGGVTK